MYEILGNHCPVFSLDCLGFSRKLFDCLVFLSCVQFIELITLLVFECAAYNLVIHGSLSIIYRCPVLLFHMSRNVQLFCLKRKCPGFG